MSTGEPSAASTPTTAVPSGPGRSTRRRGWAVVFAATVVLQLGVLYWPSVSVQGPVSWTDKVVHPVVFLLPVVAGSLWWGRWRPVAVVFALHAPLSEVVQHAVLPHRSGDVWDAVADLAGVALGVLLVVLAARLGRSGPPATRW